MDLQHIIAKKLWDIYGFYLIDEQAAEHTPCTHTYKIINDLGTVIMEHVTLDIITDFFNMDNS